MEQKHLLHHIMRIKAIAETGLLYNSNEYDRERYTELQEISFELLTVVSGLTIEALKQQLPAAADYPTAKVDIRALILSADKKILMVKESADGKWSLPGGWGEVGYSPKETVIKECKEETGLDVTVGQLVAVFDKRLHPHPPEPYYVYKMVFYCEAITSEIQKGFDVLDVQYFPINDLPELSENRILKSQIEMVYKKIKAGEVAAYFD